MADELLDAGAQPAAPEPARDDSDPFAAEVEKARHSEGLGERFGLNLRAAARGTVAGVGRTAVLESDVRGGQEATDEFGNPIGTVPPSPRAADLLEAVRTDEARFAALRSYRGTMEGAVSLAGQLAGGFASPESFVTRAPGLTALAERGAARIGGEMAGRIVGAGATQAAVAGGASVGTQTVEKGAGEIDAREVGIHAALGLVMGAALHGAVGEPLHALAERRAKAKVAQKAADDAREQQLVAAAARSEAGVPDEVPEIAATGEPASVPLPEQVVEAPSMDAAKTAADVPSATGAENRSDLSTDPAALSGAEPGSVKPEPGSVSLTASPDLPAEALQIRDQVDPRVTTTIEQALAQDPAMAADAGLRASRSLGEMPANGRPEFAPGRKDGGELVQADQAASNALTDIRSPQTSMRRLADTLDLWRSDQKLRFRGAEGEYDPVAATTRLRNISNVDVFTHEAGHHVEYRVGLELSQLVQENLASIAHVVPDHVAIADLRPGEFREEAFAEWMNRFLLSEDAARAASPSFFEAFTSFMIEKHPKMLRSLIEFRDAYQAWEAAPSGLALRSTIVQPAEIAATSSRQTGNPLQRGAVGEFFYRVNRTFFGKEAPLHDLAVAVSRREGAPLPSDQNPGVLLNRASHAAQRSTERDYTIGVGGRPHEATINGQLLRFSPKDVMDGFTTDPRTGLYDPARMTLADSYVRSRRSLSLIEEFRAGLRDRRPDIGTVGDHVAEVAGIEAAHPEFKTLAEMLSVINADRAHHDFENHLITATQRDEMLANKTYVPFQRDMRLNDAEMVGGAGGGGAGRGKSLGRDTIRRLEGSDRDILSPLSSLVRQMHESNIRIRMNEPIKAIADLVGRLGEDGGAVGEMIPLSRMTANKVDALDVLKTRANELQLPKEDAERLVAMAEDFLAGQGGETTLFRSEKLGPNDVGGNVLFYREDGIAKALLLRDTRFGREIYEAVNAVGKANVDMATAFAANAVQIFRVSTTGNLTFALKNMVVDVLTRTLTDPRMGRTGTVIDYVPGMPFLTSGLGTARELVAKVFEEAFEKSEALARLVGGEQGAALFERTAEHVGVLGRTVEAWMGNARAADEPSLAVLERALLAREGLIGGTQFDTTANILRATEDPLKILGTPNVVAERPFVSLVQAAYRGVRSDIENGVPEQMSEAMRLYRRLAEEKYGPDAPALGLRITKDYTLDAAKLAVLDPLKTGLAAFRYLAEISEPAGRFAAARGVLRYELRASGVSKTEFNAFLRDADAVSPEVKGNILSAIFEAVTAANGVADFQRSGTIMANSRLAVFLNANLQGLAAHGETVAALLSPESRAATPKAKAVADNRAYLMWQVGSVMAATVGWTALKTSQGDERWQDVPDWKKQRSWIFPITDEFNFEMPKPYEWKAYFNAAEAVTEWVAGKGSGSDALRKFRDAFQDALTPPNPFTMGPVTEIPAAVRSNYDAFRAKPIISEKVFKNSPEMQYDQRTHEAAKIWAGFWNRTFDAIGMGDTPERTRHSLAQVLFSPMMADYVAKSMLGGAYTDIKGAVLDPMNGKPFDPTTSPMTRAFLSRSLTYGQARLDMSENVSRHGGQIASALADYSRLVAERPDDAQAYFRKLSPDQQDYVAVMAPDRKGQGDGVKKLHPMSRTAALASAIIPLSQMVDSGTVSSTDGKEAGKFTISDAIQRQRIGDTLSRIHELEARNTLILSGDPSWKGAPYKTAEVAALYDKLNELDPRVHRELANRYATERVIKFSKLYDPETGDGVWPQARDRLREVGAKVSLAPFLSRAASGGYELSGKRVKKVIPRGTPQFVGADED